MIGQKIIYSKNAEDIDLLLQRIAYHLMINASYASGLGLYHGKMGIVLFFAHYAKYTNEPLYDDFAGEILGEIAEEIHLDTPVSFEHGLSGIGWGVEYLLQNGFAEGDAGEILSDIDRKIMEISLCRVSDTDFRIGLGGILCYIDTRLSSSQKQSEAPFGSSFLAEYESAKKKYGNTIVPERDILAAIWEKLPEGEDITGWRYGIETGCAGYGLKCMLS